MNAHANAGGETAAIAAHAHVAFEERETGFWLYLLSDAIIFALLFATYGAMHERTAGGPTSNQLFDLGHVFIETMLLLASSFTFGVASIAAESGRKWATLAWLAITFALGLSFVSMEVSEFLGMVGAGAGRIEAASCRPSSRWSARTGCTSRPASSGFSSWRRRSPCSGSRPASSRA